MSAAGSKKARHGRRPKAVDPHELAAILAFADLHDDAAAAEKFGISARTIRRRRAEAREGKDPKLAELVQEQRREIGRRSTDRIVDTVDQLLLELQSRKTKLTNEELIDAVDKVGALRVQRDALTPPTDLDGQHSQPDQPGARPAEGADPDAGGEVRAPGAAGAAGSQPGAARVLQ